MTSSSLILLIQLYWVLNETSTGTLEPRYCDPTCLDTNILLGFGLDGCLGLELGLNGMQLGRATAVLTAANLRIGIVALFQGISLEDHESLQQNLMPHGLLCSTNGTRDLVGQREGCLGAGGINFGHGSNFDFGAVLHTYLPFWVV